ncbi:hypothetical protein KEM48_010750 [Puccinia striiformis f. sp. tritici PST-130]|nr:hypothetical protein Pst134EB_018843 [Puccinia striiformis f. sp. tritici]KAI9625797.1 hypothetical protein KEM48_010750 [Puccinia striiformis f. sp. tritici PST-130]
MGHRFHSRIDDGLDVELFYSRLEFFIKSWKGANGPDAEKLKSCGGILLGEVFPLSGAIPLHVFLFGDMLRGTLVFITPKTVTLICSPEQAAIVRPLAEPRLDQSDEFKIDVQVIIKPKRSQLDSPWMEFLLTSVEGVISKSKNIGLMAKDKSWAGWGAFLKRRGKNALLRSATMIERPVSMILAAKNTQEIKFTQIASRMSHRLMSLTFSQIISLVNNETEITQEEVGNLIRDEYRRGRIWKGENFGTDFHRKHACLRLFPVIRSNGDYGFNKSERADAQQLGNTGIFLISLAIKYQSYSSWISRTLMIDPHPTQQENYFYLLELHRFALGALKEGVVARDFHDTINRKVQTDRPDLRLPKSFGSSLGVDHNDPLLTLNEKCCRVLESQMMCNLSLGFVKIEDPFDSGETYSLHLTDTVLIGEEGSTILFDGLKELSDISFFSSSDPPRCDQEETEDCGEISDAGFSANFSQKRSTRSHSCGEERHETKRQKVDPASSIDGAECRDTKPTIDLESKIWVGAEIETDIKPPQPSEDHSDSHRTRRYTGNLAAVENGDTKTWQHRGMNQRRSSIHENPEGFEFLKRVRNSMIRRVERIEDELGDLKAELNQNLVQMREWIETESRTEWHRATPSVEGNIKMDLESPPYIYEHS